MVLNFIKTIWLLYNEKIKLNIIYIFGITITDYTIVTFWVLIFNSQFQMALFCHFIFFYFVSPHNSSKAGSFQFYKYIYFFNLSNVHFSFLLLLLSSSVHSHSLSLTPTSTLSRIQYIYFFYIFLFCILTKRNETIFFFLILLQSPLWSLWNVFFNNFMRLFFIHIFQFKKMEIKKNRNERSETCLCLCKP